MFLTLSPYYFNTSCILTTDWCFEGIVDTYYSNTKQEISPLLIVSQLWILQTYEQPHFPKVSSF